MGENLARKIIGKHLADGEMVAGQEIGMSVDQTLITDLQVLGWQQFISMDIPRGKTSPWVQYIDHNLLQGDFRSADDQEFLQAVAAKYGAHLSRAGNGICHQVHLERFAVPGKTMVGTDSHTPTAAGVGSLGIGAGALDVVAATGSGVFYFAMPKILGIRLTGRLAPWVTGKDVILEVLRRLTVKGGVGKILEYYGPGVATLSVPQRATIGNMGAETGATTSIFPSDDRTRTFLLAQGREADWQPLAADPDATYDETLEIDLAALEPLVARPHSPDNVVTVREIEGLKVDQVCVGSCTNASYEDLMTVAAILKGKTVHPNLSFTLTPGSKQVYSMLAGNGALQDLLDAGTRVLESACGPCEGMGLAPGTGAVSVRSFNRNFPGRSGTVDAQVYLASPETCAATALAGVLTDPRELGDPPVIVVPERFRINDNMIVPPAAYPEKVELTPGPNIKPAPVAKPVPDVLKERVVIKVGSNITTDDILPAGSQVLPYRSNIPAIAEFMFSRLDPTYVARVKDWKGGIIVAASNYGQGSSREHAALSALHFGIRAVIAVSYARIHYTNLVNLGIIPLTFADAAGYDGIDMGDHLHIEGIHASLQAGTALTVRNRTKGTSFQVTHAFTKRQLEILMAGGLLNYSKAVRS